MRCYGKTRADFRIVPPSRSSRSKEIRQVEEDTCSEGPSQVFERGTSTVIQETGEREGSLQDNEGSFTKRMAFAPGSQ